MKIGHGLPSIRRTLVVCAALVSSACGGSSPHAKSAASRAELHDVIDQMLAEERAAVRARGRSSGDPYAVVDMPEVETSDIFPDAHVQPEPSSDTFNEDVLRIQETVPTWNNGTGIALKFLREQSGARVSLIYVDPTPPLLKQGADHWIIQGTARSKRQTLGHFVLLLKTLEPGRYRGSASDDAVVMSTSMESEWRADDPDTTWSVNEDSWCELVLETGDDPSVLQGHFRGKLIDNQGTGFHTIESGYVFIKQ